MSEVPPTGGAATTFATGFSFPDGLACDTPAASTSPTSRSGTVSKVTANREPCRLTLGGTAESGVAYSGVTASPLTFGIGQTTADITGTLLSDPGPNQTLTLTLGTPTRAPSWAVPPVNTLTITEPAAVQFGTGSETVNAERRHVQHPVTVAGTHGTPTVSTFASGFNEPSAWPSTPPATSTSPTTATTR